MVVERGCAGKYSKEQVSKENVGYQGDAKSIQEYWEAMHTAKRGVAKEQTLSVLYVDTMKGKKRFLSIG